MGGSISSRSLVKEIVSGIRFGFSVILKYSLNDNQFNKRPSVASLKSVGKLVHPSKISLSEKLDVVQVSKQGYAVKCIARRAKHHLAFLERLVPLVVFA